MTNVRALQERATLAVVIVVSLAAVCMFAAAPAMAEFGLERFAISARNENGTPDVQAGSHPYSLTTTFVFNLPIEGDVRDVKLELPPGFVGDPNATPRCPYQEFIKQSKQTGECPIETQVGVASTFVSEKGITGVTPTTDPVYNLIPPNGMAAEFGYLVAGKTPVFLDASVRTGTDYGLDTTASEISQAVLVAGSKVSIWGVPADPAHNDVRDGCVASELGAEVPVEKVGWGLTTHDEENEKEGPIGPYNSSGAQEQSYLLASFGDSCSSEVPVRPLLTNPTSCGVPRTASLSVDDWEEPGVFRTRSASLPALEGCGKLDFSPTVGVTPDGSGGSTPTGLSVGVHVPQETTENPVGLAEADVKNTTVTLPAGVALSPGASDGLEACSEAEAGFTGFAELDPSVEPGVQSAQFSEAAVSCPLASKVANVRIKTPLLEHELLGSVFLAAPQNFLGVPENPFSSLVALYLVAEEPVAGVRIKLAGKVVPNPVTGQLTTTFENTPQLPFSDLELEFYGTDRAPLTTPALCGTYATEGVFAPSSDTPAVTAESSFNITSGPNGSSCADPLPFAPTLESGTTNINAGGFTPLVTTFSREDGQQSLASIQLHYPNGVTGLISGVAQCGEAQANAGTCGPESVIGETIVSVGLGSDPFNVTGGKVYLTGPYEGAPFGLSIVNPAKAGPFDLQEGRPVIVRAKIEVNPQTSALTVTTNAPGSPYSIPSIIDGIPLQIKHVYVNVNRPGFTINPTNCNPQQVTGTVTSTEGASSPVSDEFQVTNCAILKFQPKVTVTTAGKASKANGASLNFKISYPAGSQGKQSWFNEARFDIPKQLPARLTTLQQACLAATFETNRAACPKASKIGTAVVHTPLLPVPLEGPVYFVSYGSAKFPDAVLALKGDNVNIELHGETFINSKTGVTSATFRNTPDVPFESIEVTVPTGPYSEFGANLPPKDNYNLCGQKLAMPTLLKAQNGLEINQNTPVQITGCPKPKTKAKHAKKHKKTNKKHKKK